MVDLSVEEYSRLTDGVEAALDEADQAALTDDRRYVHEEVFGGMRSEFMSKKTEQYQLMNAQLEALIHDVPHHISNMANATALIYHTLEDINWVGFYLVENGILVLGPFQGKTACIEIRVGKGVCGTAVERDEVLLVEDVHQFPGHIACDFASNSEIVLPIHVKGEIIGVLDIDSPSLARFDKEDQEGLAEFVKIFEKEW